MTIGNAIDGSSECKKVSWQDISVKKGIQAVKMTCEVSPDVLKAEFDRANAAYEKAYAAEAESKEKHLQNSLMPVLKDSQGKYCKAKRDIPHLKHHP